MSTVTTSKSSTAASLATSAKFKTFAIVFALSAPVLYVLCDIFGLPLFTYHPATNRIDLGWAPGRSGEGPAMYWYGWTVTSLVAASVLGLAATLLPQPVARRIPLALVWIVPILAVPILIYSLRSFWLR